jgi:uncharacterized protein (DUF1697 family)
MADLRNAFEKTGLKRVQTYIQSGNVLFESNEEEERLRQRIEDRVKIDFGFSVQIVLRTADELERIIGNCPFSRESILEAKASAVGESLHVAMLSDAPSQKEIEQLSSYKSENEEYQIIGREVYLLFRDSIRNSKLANQLQKLDVIATVRNWIMYPLVGNLKQRIQKMNKNVYGLIKND